VRENNHLLNTTPRDLPEILEGVTDGDSEEAAKVYWREFYIGAF